MDQEYDVKNEGSNKEYRVIIRFGGKRGYADMRVCGYADMRVCGYADMRVCGYADMRICGYAGMRICGYVELV